MILRVLTTRLTLVILLVPEDATEFHNMEQPNEERSNSVQSIERVIAILTAFNREQREYSLTELSQKVGLTKSTMHRLLANLEHFQFIERDKQTQRYRLGIKLFELGVLVQTGFKLHDQARPILQQLTDTTGQASYLCIIEGNDVLCLDRIEGSDPVRVLTLELGGRIPFHCGGAPRALIAFLPDQRINDILGRGLRPITSQTIVDAVMLRNDIAMTRTQGYVVAHGDFTEHISAIGAPIFDHNHELAGAISIAGLEQRFNSDHIEELIEKTCAAAISISRRLGYAGRHPAEATVGRSLPRR
jgi:IclR family transcriptional regulator, KDG regulon repressor